MIGETTPGAPEAAARERISTALFYAVVILLGYLVFRIFEPFLEPLGWACVVVVFLYPWHRRLERRFGATRAALFSTLGVMFLLIVPALFVATAFVRELTDTVRQVQQGHAEGSSMLDSLEQLWEKVRQHLPFAVSVDIRQVARDAAELVGQFLVPRIGRVFLNAAVFLFNLFVMLFATFYVFRDAGKFVKFFERLLPFHQVLRERMLTQARDLIYASVSSSLIVAAVQGLLGGLAFLVLGIGAPVFWGVMMGFFSLLPMVGAWIIWLPAALWLMFTGSMVRGIILVVIGAGLVGMVDNLLRPMLVSGRAQLGGLVIFISMLGGIAVFGMLGVVLGPVVVAAAVGVMDAYFKQEELQTSPP